MLKKLNSKMIYSVFLTALGFGMAWGQSALAEILVIPAVFPDSYFNLSGDIALNAYLLEDRNGDRIFRYNVHFPKTSLTPDGMKICKFSMVFRDADSTLNISARLVSKALLTTGSAFIVPTAIAGITTTGSHTNLRVVSIPLTVPPKIDETKNLYFAEIIFPIQPSPPDPARTQVSVLQIEYKPTCP